MVFTVLSIIIISNDCNSSYLSIYLSRMHYMYHESDVHNTCTQLWACAVAAVRATSFPVDMLDCILSSRAKGSIAAASLTEVHTVRHMQRVYGLLL